MQDDTQNQNPVNPMASVADPVAPVTDPMATPPSGMPAATPTTVVPEPVAPQTPEPVMPPAPEPQAPVEPGTEQPGQGTGDAGAGMPPAPTV